jgi:hypothetical protein
MESVTGTFRTRRYLNLEGLGIFFIMIGTVLFLVGSAMIARMTSDQPGISTLWALLIIPIAIAITGIIIIVQSKNDKKRQFSLTFSLDDNGVTISRKEGAQTLVIVASNLLWHEAHIVEYSLGSYYYKASSRIRRYIRLRVWNSQKQVIFVEYLPDGWNPGYPIQTLTFGNDYPDYFSIIPGTIEKVEQMFGSQPKQTEKEWC